jgi:hypothetical protein
MGFESDLPVPTRWNEAALFSECLIVLLGVRSMGTKHANTHRSI